MKRRQVIFGGALSLVASKKSYSQLFFPLPEPVCSVGNDTFTKSMLHLNGTNGSTTIIDNAVGAGGSPLSWTPSGGAALSTATPKFGPASLLLATAPNDFISTPNNSLFNALGGQSFVVDLWFNTAVTVGSMFITGVSDSAVSPASSSFVLQIGPAPSGVGFSVFSGGVIHSAATVAGVYAPNTWNHLAGVANGSQVFVAINGVVTAGALYTPPVHSTVNVLSIGRSGASSSFPYTGKIDEYRLSIGTTRGWTTNFTPPPMAYCP